MSIWTILAGIIGNPALRSVFVGPIGKWLAKQLPDVTEDAVGDFLIEVGQDLKAQNP